MPEPTIADVFNLLQNNATKEDMDDIKERIDSFKSTTNEKIDDIEQRVTATSAQTAEHADQLVQIQAAVELLKQEHLKNNICISGVPPNLIKDGNTDDLIIQIASKLSTEITKFHFSSYPIANNKFIIAQFNSYAHKQQLLRRIFVKKSLMVEEVFQGQSNSQIYLNDHLTPYMNRLYLLARKAKKEGKLASASSFGGKVKARKSADDAPVLITTEKQLQSIIDTEQIDLTDENQLVSETMDTKQTPQATTSNQNSTNTRRPKITDQNSTNNSGRKRRINNSKERIDKNSPKKTKK